MAGKFPEDRVNVAKGTFQAHVFHLFLASAKACLFPFLTLFFRMVGLTPEKIGIIIGVKAWISLWCAPLWTRCAKGFNKKRVVLVFSLFIMMASNLVLTLVPPVDPELPLLFCSTNDSFEQIVTENAFDQDNSNVTQSLSVTGLGGVTEMTTSMWTETSTLPNKIITTPTPIGSSIGSTPFKAPSTSMTTSSSTSAAMTSSPTIPTTPPVTEAATSKPDWKNKKKGKQGKNKEAPKYDLTEDDLTLLKELGLTVDDLGDLTDEELQNLVTDTLANLDETADTDIPKKQEKHRQKRDIFESVVDKFSEKVNQFRDSLSTVEYRTFMLVLVLICAGELLSAGVDKLADDCWFEYLDVLDVLERYGSHKVWATFGGILFPVIVTAIIENTTCFLPRNIHHFMIHFYMFAAMAGFTFIFAFFYPISQRKKTPKKTTLIKGIKVLFSDMHSFSMTFTIVILGMCYSCIYNFLFWRVQDLEGNELVMGTAVSVAAASEFVMMLLHKSLVKHLTPAGAMVLGMLILAGRLVFYSFLWQPWIVVAGEVLHGFSHTLIWGAVQCYPDFRINPFIMDRSANAVSNALYYGVGFAGGSILSGYIYEAFGFSILCQGAAALIGLWCLIFLIINRCVKKRSKVRYAKLLQAEEDRNSDEDGDVSYDDDWLEVALKRDR